MAIFSKSLPTLVCLVFFGRARARPSPRANTTLPASNAPDPNLWYTMTTAQAGDGNCLYAELGVDGSSPYPTRFESCTPLQDTALWRLESDTEGGYYIYNKGWPGTHRMDINTYQATIMFMGLANDARRMQHWSVNPIDGAFELINGNTQPYPMVSMSLDDGYVAVILVNSTTANPYTANWMLVQSGVVSNTTTSSITSSTSSSSSPSATTDFSAHTPQEKGLSEVTIAAIVMGVLLGLGALCSLIFVSHWLRRRRARKQDIGGDYGPEVKTLEQVLEDPARSTKGSVVTDSVNTGPAPIPIESTEYPDAIPGVRDGQKENRRGDGDEQQTREHTQEDLAQPTTGTVVGDPGNTGPSPITTEITDNPSAIPRGREMSGGNGFEQRVRIYKPGSLEYRLGKVLIDTGNAGPNVITDNIVEYVDATPGEPWAKMVFLDGSEKPLGGNVSIEFSGHGEGSLLSKRFKEEFCHTPMIQGGFDMLLNQKFYRTFMADKIPTSLAAIMMIRGRKLTPEEIKKEKEKEEERLEIAKEANRQQNEQRERELRAAEALRQQSGGGSGSRS